MTTAVPSPAQDPFVIAAGAIRPCEVPIRTIATSPIGTAFPVPPPCSAEKKPFTPSVYSNQVQTGKTEQINEILRSILEFLTLTG
ncbi:MAG TPA: hypothetical protein VN522_02160 [Solirubrobacterales bacterium]|nr:hypothetical protein [Solirubrobacterales bacterium]